MYDTMMMAENSIKKFLHAKMEETYLKELKDSIKGYSGFTTLNLFVYLKEQWGELHAIDITTLQGKMNEFFYVTKGMSV